MRRALTLSANSVFEDVEAASRFFERGAIGWSPEPKRCRCDCLELQSLARHVEPLAADHVASSGIEAIRAFPAGSVAFDSALLMGDIHHRRIAHAALPAAGAALP